MRQSARQIADHASFQAFMNSYLKEVDPGVWHQANHWQQQTGQTLSAASHQVLELKLPSQNVTLAVGVSYRSQVGRHTLTEVFQKPLHQFDWQTQDFFSAILLLIKEIYAPAPGAPQSDQQRKKELELLARLIESQQVMTRYLEQRMDDPKLHHLNFIDSEQSILFGHWLHPTPKSRQGIHDWQHQDYTPELCGEFQLHYFAVDRTLVDQGSILSQSAESILEQILIHEHTPALKANQILIPTHPLQAQWLLHQDYIQQRIAAGDIQEIGPLGARFTPTSSVRTLYCESLDFMVKLSIPVKVTNSMRINMHHELEAGIVVANLLRTTQFSHKYPRFQTIDDPAYVSVTLPEREESGFELIIRENPFSRCQANADQLSVISLAALTQDSIINDQPSRLAQLIHQLADNQQTEQLQEQELAQAQAQAKEQPIAEVAMNWFKHYWQCAIEPAIRLYDEHGIALEAHQQNSLLDVTDGLPSRYFYRDNQGFYLSNAHKRSLMALEPKLAHTPELFYDDEMIVNRFSYYLIVNQLFSVINRLGIDQLLPEHRALELSVSWLADLSQQLTGQGKVLVDALLSQRDIAFKGNLLTRIHDVDELQADQELAVYTKIKNPFRAIAFAQELVTNETNAEQKMSHQGTASAPHAIHLNALITASEQASAVRFSEVPETTEVQRESA